MTSQLSLVKTEIFEGNQTDIYSNQDNYFMTAEQLGNCLKYSNPTIAINKLTSRNEYLKSDEFSVVTKLVSTDGKTYNTRLFNEDGIYEIAFLSKTAIAQAFRSWVRKILKELRQQVQNNSQFNPLYGQSQCHLQQSQNNLTNCVTEHGYKIDSIENRLNDLESVSVIFAKFIGREMRHKLNMMAAQEEYSEFSQTTPINQYKPTIQLTPIQQLINIRNDKSYHGVATYRKVYQNMYSSIQWKRLTTKYKRQYGVKTITKPMLVNNDIKILSLFNKTVQQMLSEIGGENI